MISIAPVVTLKQGTFVIFSVKLKAVGSVSVKVSICESPILSKTVTVSALVFGIIVLVILKPLFSYARSLASKMSKINVSIAHHINESIVGIKTLKVLGTGSFIDMR